MRRSAQRAGILFALLAIFVALPATSARAQDEGPSPFDVLRRDAELTEVSFVDANTGWAVGDRGVIWHTRDGGRRWELQESQTHCRLNSVVFRDAQNGVAVGGWTQPFTHASHGVVLRTRDGGQTWQPQRGAILPELYRVKFFGRQQGIAFGKPSALFPTGVFTTGDGGASWTPVAGGEQPLALAGDFSDPHTGALAGRLGDLTTMRTGKLTSERPLGFEQCIPRRMLLTATPKTSPPAGWLVGDGGLVLTTGDQGASWQQASSFTSSLAESVGGDLRTANLDGGFDLLAIAVLGRECWIAGSPGTCVFHTADGGQSWRALNTGQFAPIRSLHFVDPQHGWAVGSLGNILATADGGQTWVVQRSGATRAAVLGIYGEADDVPVEIFAKLAAADGYISQVELLVRRDLDPQSDETGDIAARAHAALVEVGASGAQTAWQFPLRQAGLEFTAEQLVETLERSCGDEPLAQLEGHLVRQIRLWRPELVLTHHVSPRGEDPLGHLINQLVLRAVEQAADANAHRALAAIGLEPWQAKKVYATLDPGHGGTTTLDCAKVEPSLGMSAAEIAATARGLIADEAAPLPLELGFRLLINHLPQDRGREDFFSGITLAPGSEARRELAEHLTSLDELRRSAQLRRNVQELIRRSDKLPQLADRWLGEAGDLTRGLEPGAACQVLNQLAHQCQVTGRWEQAADTYRTMIERHPDHPLSQAAQLWLVRYYASGEAAWRLRGAAEVQQAAVVPKLEAVTPVEGVVPASAIERDATAARLERACQLGVALEKTQPRLFAEPSLRFAVAAAQRQTGVAAEAERFYQNFRRGRSADAWRAAAQGEQWIKVRAIESPKPLWRVGETRSKPRLDGHLDDDCWSQCQPIALASQLHDDEAWPASAKLSADGEFLYLGVSCQKAPGVTYAEPAGTRTRDADLRKQDRVELLLDIDRDFGTFYRLAVDHRGWTAEACWNDPTWNPTWYVARSADETQWTIEAAIPLKELGPAPEPATVWAAGIQRIVPGQGFQSWTQPAGARVKGEGMGYLVFGDAKSNENDEIRSPKSE